MAYAQADPFATEPRISTHDITDKPRILIVEDEDAIAETLAYAPAPMALRRCMCDCWRTPDASSVALGGTSAGDPRRWFAGWHRF